MKTIIINSMSRLAILTTMLFCFQLSYSQTTLNYCSGDAIDLTVTGSTGVNTVVCVDQSTGLNEEMSSGIILTDGTYKCYSISTNNGFSTSSISIAPGDSELSVQLAVDATFGDANMDGIADDCAAVALPTDLVVSVCQTLNCEVLCDCASGTITYNYLLNQDPAASNANLIVLAVDANGIVVSIDGPNPTGSIDVTTLAVGSYTVFSVNSDLPISIPNADWTAFLATVDMQFGGTAADGTGTSCVSITQNAIPMDIVDCGCALCEVSTIIASPTQCSIDGLTYSVNVTWSGGPDASLILDDANATVSGNDIAIDANGTAVFTYTVGTDYNITVTDAEAVCAFGPFSGTSPSCSCDLTACLCTGENTVTYTYTGGGGDLVFAFADATGAIVMIDPILEAGVQNSDISSLSTGVYTLYAIHTDPIAVAPLVGDNINALDVCSTSEVAPISVEINPASCGCGCAFDPLLATNVICNGDGTFSFDIAPTAAGGSTWSDSEGNTGAYGVAQSYGPYVISMGDVQIDFFDVTNPTTCSQTIIVSVPASFNALTTSNILCDDNGTATDPSDDTFTFDVLVDGMGSTWSDDQGNSGLNYGMIQSYGPYPISGGNITVAYSDDSNSTCTGSVVAIPPLACSNAMPCSLDILTASNILCDDNGTNTDPSDDTYTFDVIVTGMNGTTWSDDQGNSGMTYGMTTSYGPFSISSGSTTINYVDDADGSCMTSVSATAPATCSGTISGCTDPCDPNYDPNATISDPVQCAGYSTTCNTDCLLGDIEVWDAVTCSCVVQTATVLGCIDPLAVNFDPAANCDDSSCTYNNPGCTDPCASNYDPTADSDDGSCMPYDTTCNTDCTLGDVEIWDAASCSCSVQTVTVNGCIDPLAANFDPAANCDDSSCTYNNPGCTDPCASNYDPTADSDDGSCMPYDTTCNTDCTIGDVEIWDAVNCACTVQTVTVNGCTDPLAANYDPTANCDDGSCSTTCVPGDAGIMPTGIQIACWGETISVASSGVNTNGQTLAYVMHDGTFTTIYGWSLSGLFANDGSIPTNIFPEPVISSVVGPVGANGYPDLADPCTVVSSYGTPSRFLTEIVITHEHICNDATGDFSVTFIVTGGYPEYPNGNNAFYTISGDWSGTAFSGVSQSFGPLADGSSYVINVIDDQKGCSATASDTPQCIKTPISLIDYWGEALAPGNNLKWLTASEVNNDFFTLERSIDGVNYSYLATVDGNGTTTDISAYEYLDKTAPSGISYYRLSQTDFDATVHAVGVVSLLRGEESFDITNLLPNPVIDELTIWYTSDKLAEVNVTIYDAIGRVMHSKTQDALNGVNSLSFSVENYSAGMYFATITEGDRVITKKFVKK